MVPVPVHTTLSVVILCLIVFKVILLVTVLIILIIRYELLKYI